MILIFLQCFPAFEKAYAVKLVQRTEVWSHMNEEEKTNLASIKWSDIADFLPELEPSSLTYEVHSYLRENGFIADGMENIIIFTKNDLESYRHFAIPSTLTNLLFGCLIFKAQDEIYGAFKRKDTPLSYCALNPIVYYKGVLSSITTMIELSNKLQHPHILPLKTERSHLELTSSKSRSRSQIFIEKVPSYGFYVEAKITLNYRVKLYLHQVIETQNGTEKSTLPIDSTVIEIDSMFNSICDVLWNTSQNNSPFDNCISGTSIYDHYQNFKSKLLVFLEETVRMLFIAYG